MKPKSQFGYTPIIDCDRLLLFAPAEIAKVRNDSTSLAILDWKSERLSRLVWGNAAGILTTHASDDAHGIFRCTSDFIGQAANKNDDIAMKLSVANKISC